MDSKPDVLWLTLESVRADHTSLYGYRRKTTPYLEELSDRSDATVLSNGYSASIWTPASTASMLTGTHLSTHQVGRDGKAEEKLPQSLPTLPQLLQDEGYETALFSPNPYIGPETGLSRGFEHFERNSMSKSNFFGFDSITADSWRCFVRRFKESRTLRPAKLRAELESSNNCLLERRVERWFTDQKSEEKPFFTYAHIQSPHHPYRPIEAFMHRYEDEIGMNATEARRLVERVYRGSEGIKRRMANGLNLSRDQLEAIISLYDAEINYADRTANAIVEAATGASNRPLVVVVTGDHGELFGECGIIGHNLALHEGLVRVPMMVVGIDGIGDDDETFSQHIDVTYTLASTCGVSTETLDGRDLRDAHRPYAISQRGIAHFGSYTKYNSNFDTSRFFKRPVSCVRTSDWKYLESKSRRALYAPPDEETDEKDARPEVVDELSEILATENVDWESEYRTESVEFDDQTRSQLNDLGYLS